MTPDQLTNAAAQLFGVDRQALMGSSRVARVAEARQALAWALRQNNWTLESIGAYLRRDHTTIIHAIKTMDRRAGHQARLRERLQALVQVIEPPDDWIARLVTLEARVAELEARVSADQAVLV